MQEKFETQMRIRKVDSRRYKNESRTWEEDRVCSGVRAGCRSRGTYRKARCRRLVGLCLLQQAKYPGMRDDALK